MKKRCSVALKNFFREQLLQTRNSLHLTQRQMESGESGCSALTFALFLAYFCDDPIAFRAELKEVFENSAIPAGSFR